MRHHKRHHLWTVGVVALALLSFLAGTSFACFQREVSSVKIAEDCCQKHCQHAMEADKAAQCCQSHQAKVSQALLAVSATKVLSPLAYSLQVSSIATVAILDAERSLVYLTTEKRPPPSLPFYVLYRALLI